MFVIFHSHSLSSIHIYIHSPSTLFVSAVNLAKEVVGNSGCWQTGREGFTYQGTPPLSLWVHPSICVIVKLVLLLLNLRCCWIHIVVVESMLLLLNPCHHCQIHTMVVKSALLLLNPCYGCCGQIHIIQLSLLWHPNLWHCWTCIMVVKSTLLWLNLHRCYQICIIQLSSLWHSNLWFCWTLIMVVKSALLLLNLHHLTFCVEHLVLSSNSCHCCASSGFRCVCWSFVEVGMCWEWVRKIRKKDNG